MSDKEHQQLTPIVTPKTNITVSTKSKKRAQPEQSSNAEKITDFFIGAQDGQKLPLIQGGVSSDPKVATNLSNIRPQLHNNSESFDSNQKSQQRKKQDSLMHDSSADQSEKKQKHQRKNNDGGSNEGSLQIRRKQNRDHCNLCKDGGDLLCCDNCPRSFHLKCLGVKEQDIPDGEWYCKQCIPIIEKKKQIEDERKKKDSEKERQIEEKRRQKEELVKEKQRDIEKKREEKRLEKEKLEEERQKVKEQNLQELKNKIQKQKEQQLSQENDLQQPDIMIGVTKINGTILQQQSPDRKLQQDSTSVESPGILEQLNIINEKPQAKKKVVRPKEDEMKAIQSLINVSNQRKVVVEEKSEAEKAKDAKIMDMKNQLKIFARIYPELVDKHSIKYPIEDQLIKKMPLVHGAENFPVKPEHKKIIIEGHQFERLLYVWEFFNNFSDYLKIPNFKLEELQAALSFNSQPEAVKIFSQEENEEQDWDEQISTKTVAEQGFALISQLHLAAISCFITELKNLEEKNKAYTESGKDNLEEDEDQLLLSSVKYVDKHDILWQEIIRIILKSKKFGFFPLDQNIVKICDEKLANCTPETYSYILTYEEKLDILETIVDGLHDLDDFRAFLNLRLEDKSSYNKQKIDIYAEIKQLENQKSELIKEHAQNNFFNNSEQIISQIDDLKKKLETANRIESRRIQQQINDLQSEKNKVLKEMQKIEDQIEKRQNKIERLNESAHKTSIKNQMLGKDCDRNEYWFYKEEPGKLFIKKFDFQEPKLKAGLNIENDQPDQIMGEEEAIESQEPKFKWAFYDEEDEFEKLIEACNVKGIRERKLQENLRKIRDRMRLKKSRARPHQAPNQNGNPSDNKGEEAKQEVQEKEDVVMEEEQLESDIKDNNKNKHILFENDSFHSTTINAIWFNKKLPSKRQVMMESKAVTTRRTVGQSIEQKVKEQNLKKQQEEIKITLPQIKQNILNIEGLYTDSGLNFQREWEMKHIREKIIESIEKSQTIQDLGQELLKLDQGFSHPHYLKYKNDNEEDSMDEQQNDNNQSGDESEKDEKMEEDKYQYDKNVRIVPLKFFKYWPNKEIRNAWRQYIFSDCVEQNISALYIAVKILEKVNGEFLQRQFEIQFKKQRKEQKQYSSNNKKDKEDTKSNNQVKGRQDQKSTSYKQFFESEDENSNSNERSKKSGLRSKPGRPGRKLKKNEEIESDPEVEPSEESSEDDEDEEKEWDDKCYVCNKGGNVICCEQCPHVAHLLCVGLKKNPEGDWHCEDCLVKLTQRRTTRGQVTQHEKITSRSGGRMR